MRIKICGMRRQEDVAKAAGLGFDFCGFIFHPPSPRNIEPVAASLLDSGTMQRAGVFVLQDACAIKAIMKTARLDWAQLHGGQTPQMAREIGAERIIRVLWPERFANMAELNQAAEQWAGNCAFLLLDAGQRGGGSGKSLDAAALASFRPPLPWFLAGGLSAANALDMAEACRPYGLDFNSGLETAPGIKDHARMEMVMDRLGRRQQ